MKSICRHQRNCRWKFRGIFKDFGLYTCHINDQKGTGLRTTDPIKEGEYVLEYKGVTMYNEDEVLDILKLPPPIYMLDAGTHWIHATLKSGNKSRYINHSCDPNLVPEVWENKGKNKIVFKARRPISGHEEVTFNYNTNNHRNVGDWVKHKCYCTEDCPNFI
jgi:SET domain-containing protein